jgi:hypothetical protein
MFAMDTEKMKKPKVTRLPVSEQERALYFRNHFPIGMMAVFLAPSKVPRCARLSGIYEILATADTPVSSFKEFHKLLNRESYTQVGDPYALWLLLTLHEGVLSLHIGSALTAIVPRATHERLLVFEEREFVIDMDLKDWGERRALLCRCEAKEICDVCWLLAELASFVCQLLISDGCGLGAMLPVFSGGKGCHLWWGAPQARQLDEETRQKIVDRFFEAPPFLLSVEGMRPPTPPGPTVSAAVAQLRTRWVQRAITKRALLADTESPLAGYLKRLAPASFVWPQGDLTAPAMSLARWKAFERAVGDAMSKAVVCHFGWPIIDAPVTLGAGHTIKAPFSIHHSTGRVALPLRSVSDCRPLSMPTINALIGSVAKSSPTSDDCAARMWDDGVAAMDTWLQACNYSSV